ncbi:hypothetical protein GCM10010376_45110 [Streptomyces violaceusniger]
MPSPEAASSVPAADDPAGDPATRGHHPPGLRDNLYAPQVSRDTPWASMSVAPSPGPGAGTAAAGTPPAVDRGARSRGGREAEGRPPQGPTWRVPVSPGGDAVPWRLGEGAGEGGPGLGHAGARG